jgi:hypothetical protein
MGCCLIFNGEVGYSLIFNREVGSVLVSMEK